MKVAIYTRVSTEEQTVLNQVIRLQEHCKTNGWEYELLQRLRNKEFGGVLVYKLDIWARSGFQRTTFNLTLDSWTGTNSALNMVTAMVQVVPSNSSNSVSKVFTTNNNKRYILRLRTEKEAART